MKQGIKIIILTTLISCSLIKHQDDILLIKSDINVNDNKFLKIKYMIKILILFAFINSMIN